MIFYCRYFTIITWDIGIFKSTNKVYGCLGHVSMLPLAFYWLGVKLQLISAFLTLPHFTSGISIIVRLCPCMRGNLKELRKNRGLIKGLHLKKLNIATPSTHFYVIV